MKKPNLFITYLFLLPLIFITLSTQHSLAQCGSCTPNESLLSPASNYPDGAFAPNPAAEIVAGEPYSETITYVMPATFDAGPPVGVINIDQVVISEINGLPQDILWNCDEADCTYYPQTYQYGCISLCGSTNVAPGIYTVDVTILATALGVTQPSVLSFDVEVVASSSGNGGFTFTPSLGCAPLTSSFEALITGNVAHDWTFGNGNSATGANPPDQTFTTSGVNEVTLTTTEYDLVLDEVTITAISNQWCGDVEEVELFGQCQGAPDLTFELTNGSGTILFTGDTVTDQLSTTWSNIGLVLDLGAQPFSILSWDYDQVSQWDDLGGVSFNLTGQGTFTSVSAHVMVSYTINYNVAAINTYTDTVTVVDAPSDAVVSTGTTQFCEGDSVLLSVSSPTGTTTQWYMNQQSLSGETNHQLWATESGSYSVTVLDTLSFCSGGSNSLAITENSYPTTPIIAFNETLNQLEVTNLGGNNAQWFADGSELVGQTSIALSNPTAGVAYSVEITNAGGCTSMSATFFLCEAGSIVPLSDDTLCCGETVQAIAQNFVLNEGGEIIWAVTPESFGPVSSIAEAQAAYDAGFVFSGASDTLNLTNDCCSAVYQEGEYIITPFATNYSDGIPALADCTPVIEICPTIVGADSTWEVSPLIFTYPDGSQLNVNDELAFGLPLTEALLELAGGLPCLDLMQNYQGDANGIWQISLTNTGPVSLDFQLPDFIALIESDTCGLITDDIFIEVPGDTITVDPGQTGQFVFTLSGDPVANITCEAFGEPASIHFHHCPELSLEADIQHVTNIVFPFTDGFIDLTVNGGTPPYSFDWSPFGGNTEYISNLTPDTYSVTVSDSLCNEVTGTWEILMCASISADTSGVVDASAFNSNDGSCSIVITGGTPPVTLEWSNSNSLISVISDLPGDTIIVFNNLSPDYYHFTISTNCVNDMITDSVQISYPVGFDVVEGGFQVYPNPSKALFQVNFTNVPEPISYRVTNNLGQVILFGNPITSNFQLDLSNHPRGVYHLEVIVEQTIVREKLIKH